MFSAKVEGGAARDCRASSDREHGLPTKPGRHGSHQGEKRSLWRRFSGKKNRAGPKARPDPPLESGRFPLRQIPYRELDGVVVCAG
jgi:hypothetical protein